MTSGKWFENEWFYMKYIGKYLSVEIPVSNIKKNMDGTRLCMNDIVAVTSDLPGEFDHATVRSFYLMHSILSHESLWILMVWFGLGFMVFNVTFNNISAISWRSVLLMEETGGPGDKHQPVASH